jgi:DNA-binding NarL/FixJ family response regulator
MRVLIVDDHALIRDSLKMLLQMEPDIQVTGTAVNGQDALEKAGEQNPDLVLMDIRMPVMDGVISTKRIKETHPQIKIVILTTFKDDEYIKEALKNGAEGYILKCQPAESIIESLRAVAMGNTVLEANIAQSVKEMLQHQQAPKEPKDFNLTPRELEIMALVGEGMSNKEIAAKLFISEGTARNYVTALLEKLGLRDRTQLAIFYIKNF